MSLFARKALVLAKVESTPGVDSSPAGADAILCRNVRLTPMNAEFASRDLVRSYFGNSENLPAAVHAVLEMETELQGSGTPGTAPKWGRLLRGAACSETTLAADVTGSAQAGAVRSITLAAGASSVDGFHVGMQLNTTSGTGTGQSRIITAYNGTTKVATVDRDWVVNPAAATGYTILANVQYRPISSALESLSMYVNMDGVQHKLLMARGSVSAALNAKGIPVLRFRFLGLYSTPTDTAAATPDYSAFRAPVVASTSNTPIFSLHNFQPVVSAFSLDLANQVVHRALIGGESVLQTDRRPTGSITFEAVTVATKDIWTVARAATLDSLALVHGASSGLRVSLGAPSVQIQPPQYSEDHGVMMVQCGLVPVPVAGNDEAWITAF